jgi:ATP-dependent RNA helicase DHX8/PRP22
MVIEPKWLVELAPQFYKSADPTRMTKQKRMEKIEPLVRFCRILIHRYRKNF